MRSPGEGRVFDLAILFQLFNGPENIAGGNDAIAEAQGRFRGVGGIKKIKGDSGQSEFREDFCDTGNLIRPVGGDELHIVRFKRVFHPAVPFFPPVPEFGQRNCVVLPVH